MQDKLLEVKQGLPFEPPKPKPKGRNQLDKDIELVNNYVDNIGINYTIKVREALQRIPNSRQTFEKSERIRNRKFDARTRSKDLRKEIKQFLQDQDLLQIKIDTKPSAVDI